MESLVGSSSVADAARTPGNEPAPSTTRSKKATCRSGVAYCAGDSATRIVSTPAASYPGDFESTPRKLRSISPPSTRRTTVTASCPATKTARNRCCVVPASTFGLPFSVAFTSCFQASHAGTTPQRTPVSSATRKLKTRTGPPRCARSAPFSSSNWYEARRRMPHHAGAIEMMPAASPSRRCSVSNCRVSRQRPPPSAARIASSRRRERLRVRSRLATLAQATASAQPTATASSVTRSSESARTPVEAAAA